MKDPSAGKFFKNSKGYTLLEILIAFSIYLLIASFLVKAVPLLKHCLYSDKTPEMEWELFLNQAKMEIRSSEKLWIEKGTLYLLNDGRTIQYEQYGTMMRRRVDREGHEPLLLNVNDVAFFVDGKWLEIRAHSYTGKKFIEKILLPNHLREKK